MSNCLPGPSPEAFKLHISGRQDQPEHAPSYSNLKVSLTMPKDACQHVVYKASGALLSGHPARRCCGHHCPVCGGHAWALDYCSTPGCSCEQGCLWRSKLDRSAHKCYGSEHRFDVEISTGRSLSDFMYRDRDKVTHTVPAGTKVVW